MIEPDPLGRGGERVNDEKEEEDEARRRREGRDDPGPGAAEPLDAGRPERTGRCVEMDTSGAEVVPTSGAWTRMGRVEGFGMAKRRGGGSVDEIWDQVLCVCSDDVGEVRSGFG